MVKFYEILLSEDPWHMNWVFTVLVSLGMTNPIWTICSCSMLAISNLKRGQTCLCLQTFSLNTLNEELICLPLMLHPFIDYIFLANKVLSNMIRSEAGLKFSVCSFIFTFLKPSNVSGTWKKHVCLFLFLFGRINILKKYSNSAGWST